MLKLLKTFTHEIGHIQFDKTICEIDLHSYQKYIRYIQAGVTGALIGFIIGSFIGLYPEIYLWKKMDKYDAVIIIIGLTLIAICYLMIEQNKSMEIYCDLYAIKNFPCIQQATSERYNKKSNVFTNIFCKIVSLLLWFQISLF